VEQNGARKLELAAPFLAAMQHIQRWTVAFHYDDLDRVIGQMHSCNAFERSRNQFEFLFPDSPAGT
jgi:cell wall assembly regulator SMI1